MARLFFVAVLLLGVALGNAQMKAPGDIGIDEKLGAQVAMDAVLKDENGNEITLGRLIDKPTILIFNYFSCPGICPVLLSNMVEVVNRMQLEPGREFRLVAVSFDPGTCRKRRARKRPIT